MRHVLAAAPLALALAFALAPAAQASPTTFEATLTGAQEVPPVETQGQAAARFTWNPETRDLGWMISTQNLSGPATMVHFHGPAAEGQNAPPVLWLVPKGERVPQVVTGHAVLTPEQARQFQSGAWYLNIHTPSHPAGEIRAWIKPPAA
jgi:hypothetical protein